MSDDAVARYQKDAVTGHRPTWKMGMNGGSERLADQADPFDVLREFGAGPSARVRPERPPEARPVRNAERKAFDTLDLEIDASASHIKARFKELVKRHHPDANGGDRSSEDRLVEIIQAYNYLKSAKFC
jgi:DnaJ-domain-containing protein 1